MCSQNGQIPIFSGFFFIFFASLPFIKRKRLPDFFFISHRNIRDLATHLSERGTKKKKSKKFCRKSEKSKFGYTPIRKEEPTSMATEEKELDEDLRDLLITISVIAKRLARKLEAEQQQKDEDPLDFGGNDNEEKRTGSTTKQRSRDVF